MMQRFTYVLFVGYIICCMAVGGEIAVKFSGDRDEMWRSEWFVEMSWYSIFSLFLLSVMILMRPNENSKLLAYVEELHDTDRNNNTQPGPNNQTNPGNDISMESRTSEIRPQNIEMVELPGG